MNTDRVFSHGMSMELSPKADFSFDIVCEMTRSVAITTGDDYPILFNSLES